MRGQALQQRSTRTPGPSVQPGGFTQQGLGQRWHVPEQQHESRSDLIAVPAGETGRRPGRSRCPSSSCQSGIRLCLARRAAATARPGLGYKSRSDLIADIASEAGQRPLKGLLLEPPDRLGLSLDSAIRIPVTVYVYVTCKFMMH